ncbi:S-layer homology domain-containing protein [Faecousia sp.]|uniref:S-layer homology domain-containing protein n=1 Tax=Faecousia sp. TaxID=2952921 RepID=UPI002A9A0C0B|nr:S-layer homology domain-containing protein [Candidatus Faecousia sp.]
MRKLSKTLLSLLLIAAMLASFVVLPAAAEEPAAEQPTEAVQAAETQSKDAVEGFDLSIVMLDCGRKYYSVDSIKQIIDNASAAGFGYIMLGVGNDGMRFLLDDMSLTVNGTTYESDAVKSAIHAGNEAYYNFAVDELTQTEMDAVLAYAKEKGMGVIPMLNTPGHMDAILAAATSLTGTNCAYSGSARTIDVTNSTAVAFTQAFVQKYVDYFASKGCKYFNMGADEYANDRYTGGSMGFGNLQSEGKYSYYVTYVNDVAAMIKNAGMLPMAFNDGIYFANNTSSGTFDTDIVICYWSNGWSGYSPMPASDLANKGFKMVNTNGSYYWVLGKPDAQCSASKASGFSINSFPGSTIDNPFGAMFCIWADYPDAETEASVISKTADTIAAFGATLPETKQGEKSETKTDEATKISVTAPGLTGITVAAVDKGTELDGKKVAGAWNIELTTANGSYTDSATVSIPVGKEWLSYKLTGGVLESDGTTVTSDPNSKVENGVLTFTAKHFSTVVVLAEEKQQEIAVTVGGTKTITVDGEVSSAYTDDFVTVKTETKNTTATPYYERAALGAGTFYISDEANDTAPSVKVTLAAMYNGQYSLYSDTYYRYPNATYHSYIIGGYWSYAPAQDRSPVGLTISESEKGAVTINREVTSGRHKTTAWLTLSYGNFDASGNSTTLYLYNLVQPTASKQTTISFTGKKAGTTQVKIGDVLYTITVSPENLDNVSPLKIEYWITNSRLTGTTSNKNELSIAATLDGVASAEGVEIASLVDAKGAKDGRTQEYWQSKILDVQKSNDSTSGTELQTTKNGDDETLNGTAFTKARYWDGKWQVFTNAWVDVDRTQVTVTDTGDVPYKGDRNQLVAYYMEVVNINNENGESELHVNAADWGTKGDGTGSWGYTPESSRCSVSIQLVYEDGSFNPSDTTAAKLKSKTIVYGYWSGGRGLGTMVFTGQQGYEIYKVTAATGTMASRTGSGNTVTVTSFTWADNEETVWEGNQTKSVSIGNPARKPSYEAPYDNLAWNTDAYNKNNAILIRVYVKTQIAEDSLIVHYVDKTTGKQFYEYGIKVKENTTFDPLFAKNESTENALVHNEVENYNGATQKVSAELKEMPQISAAYRYSKYTLVEVERKTDGKEVILYYTFNNKHTFVVDFGVPLKIKATDIGVTVPEGDSYWTEATCTGAVYGETKIANGEGLTYTATKPMLGIETLNVTLATGTGEDDKATHTIYLVPATTVYYEQNVATYSTGWDTLGTIAPDKYQEAQKGRTPGYNFGYDPYYEANQLGAGGSVEYTNTKGADATLTFKGTGMELYLRTQNANETSNLDETDATNHSYMLVQVYAGDTADANNLKRMSFVDVNNLFVQSKTGYGYNTPCWTVDGMAYGTYTVVVRYVKGTTYGLAIDGFRVTNTLNPSDATTNGFYADVGEANMQTAEIRNMVLKQAEVYNLADNWYKVGNEVIDAVYDAEDAARIINGAVLIKQNYDQNGGTDVQVTSELVNIGPKNEIYLNPGEAVVMTVPTTYTTVQVGMRSLTGETVKYQINSEPTKEMKSTVDMYYRVALADGGKLVIQNKSDSKQILALTKLKVTGAGTTTNDVSVETTPEAIRYAMALMRGIDVPQFTDVAEDAWYHDYVYDLVYRGVVNGMTATTYEPEGKLTRAQFVKLLACSLADAETLKTYEGKHPFKDSEGHWAEAYIAWAKDKGIVEGVSATEFDPEAPITREQMATIFGRYALKQGIELPKSENAAGSFPDAGKISEYAREFVELMRIAGILNGYEDGTFRPQGNATRAEAAKLFSLFLSITDKLAK